MVAQPDEPRNGRISLHPLSFEEALEALLQTGPHPKDDEPVPESMRHHHEQHHARKPRKKTPKG
jgi:hypothetical protein